MKALATNASKRIPELPDVPTVREHGFPALEADGWNGLFAPAKTPSEIIERLQKETTAAVRHPELQKRLADLAAGAVGSSPAEQDAILRRQIEQFRPITQTMRLLGARRTRDGEAPWDVPKRTDSPISQG